MDSAIETIALQYGDAAGTAPGFQPTKAAPEEHPPEKLDSAVQPAGDGPGFRELGLCPEILEALKRLKFVKPSDIQREMIPIALSGRDVLGQARTGTGKTAAFALPLLQLVRCNAGAQALILVPTRELAVQVDEQVRQLGVTRGLRTVVAYGGVRLGEQAKRLKDGAEIVIGTPGRVMDLHRRRLLSFDSIIHVVLDEVDRMLDIGFRDDIRKILGSIRSRHQTLFVSATINDEIRRLAKSYMREPAEINVSQDRLTVDTVHHGYVTVEREHKIDTLLAFLKAVKPTLVIVFTNMKSTARKVAKRLTEAGVNCREIHGDLIQRRREKVLDSFRKAHIQVLVATDLASRGLDVMEVSHIVNYDIPEDSAVYVHRIGRTARMGKSGYAVTFVSMDEGGPLTEIEMLINRQLPRFEEPWAPKLPDPHESGAATRLPAAHAGDEEPAKPPIALRYAEPVKRCEVLDSLGLKPIQRTLGSRFRASRKRR